MNLRMTAVAALLLATCRPDPVAVERSPSPSPRATAGEHVAVLATGEPDDLEDETRRIMAEAPRHVAVSPVSCWPGLAEELGLASDVYVAAVIAASVEELDAVLARMERKPRHRGVYQAACGD